MVVTLFLVKKIVLKDPGQISPLVIPGFLNSSPFSELLTRNWFSFMIIMTCTYDWNSYPIPSQNVVLWVEDLIWESLV